MYLTDKMKVSYFKSWGFNKDVLQEIVATVIILQVCSIVVSGFSGQHAFRNPPTIRISHSKAIKKSITNVHCIRSNARFFNGGHDDNDVARKDQTCDIDSTPTNNRRRSTRRMQSAPTAADSVTFCGSRRESVRHIAIVAVSTYLGVATTSPADALAASSTSKVDECQTVCMYECSQKKASSVSSSLSSTTDTCKQQCASTTTSSCSATPQNTMTREPKLVQSSRIDNLYETWQDKFCVDEKSICARDTVDK